MKKISRGILLISSLALLVGCGEHDQHIEPTEIEIIEEQLALDHDVTQSGIFNVEYSLLEDIRDDYSLEQAKLDQCVVHENSDITSGQEVWDCFLEACVAKEACTVRLGTYYTLRDPSHYSKEHYEEIKDDYPVLYITDLNFDGESYTVKFYDQGELIIRDYKYLLKYEGKANVEATYTDYTYYVLVNDETVTWADIWNGMISSQLGAAIDHWVAYQDKVYK